MERTRCQTVNSLASAEEPSSRLLPCSSAYASKPNLTHIDTSYQVQFTSATFIGSPILARFCEPLKTVILLHSPFTLKNRKPCQKTKSFRSSLFQKACRGTGTESPKHNVRSEKGELKNNPVDCFLRGKALQERAFPSCSASLIFLRALACAIAV